MSMVSPPDARRRALLAGLGASAAAALLPRAARGATPMADLRLDSLHYQPDIDALKAAWRALADELAAFAAPPPQAAVQALVRRAGVLYTWQTWNFEYQDAPFWLAVCAANHALYAHHGHMLVDQAYAVERVALAFTRLRDAVRGIARAFPPRDPAAALAHYRALLPASPPARGAGPRPLWGDLHIHTALSYDAFVSPWHALRFAREVSGFDFVALTDHAFYFGHPRHPYFKASAAAMYGFVRELAATATVPGHFTALVGLEWEGRYAQGHRQLVFAPDSPPAAPYALTNPDTNAITRLWAAFDRAHQRVLTIAHHTAYAENPMGNALMHWNDRYDRLIEVVSDNGEYERPGDAIPATRGEHAVAGRTVSDALAKGMRLGIVGDSDCHFGIPGLGVPDTTGFGGPPGYTAVLAQSNSAADIYAALAARRCYATDGQRIDLEFSVNGEPMGSELALPPSTTLKFRVAAAAADKVVDLTLLRNEQPLQQWAPGVSSAALDFELPGETAKGGALAASGRSARETDQFRLRVRLANGRRAWSSPVWVDYTV